MKLLSTNQTSAVAGGFVPAIVSTTLCSLASSAAVAAGSASIGFGGSTLLAVSLPVGILGGMVAYHESRSHGGNLGAGGIVGAFFSGTSTLVGNALGYKASPGAKPAKPDIYCLTHDCTIS